MASLWLEMRYALRERTVLLTLLAGLLASAYAVITGMLAVDQQRAEISALMQDAEQEIVTTLPDQADAGSAAYYVYHVTFQEPSKLAFAALGSREELAWQHRVKMLALEGQIYETDIGNPQLSGLGRLDFAFLVAVLLPLLAILLLYDLDGRERREGRLELLLSTSRNGHRTLHVKGLARMDLLFVAIALPFIIAAFAAGVELLDVIAVLLVVAAVLAFWLIVCRLVSVRLHQAPAAAAVLLALWLTVTSVVPAMGSLWVEASVPVPSGGELLLAQREKVNDAWDLPKEATMQPFVASYPEWQDYTEVSRPFEWKWYYAFHQVGDEFVQADANALQTGIARRDAWMGWLALLSPALASERWLTHLAGTDRTHHQRYLQCVRDFHSALRNFHYPMLFGQSEYSSEAMASLPRYQPCDT